MRKKYIGKPALPFLIFYFSLFIPGLSLAQPRITLDSCISRALESNYSIKIIRNELKQAENNLNYAPFMPTVSANAGQKQSLSDSKVLTGGEDRGIDNAKTNALSAGVALNWRLFDGM